MGLPLHTMACACEVHKMLSAVAVYSVHSTAVECRVCCTVSLLSRSGRVGWRSELCPDCARAIKILDFKRVRDLHWSIVALFYYRPHPSPRTMAHVQGRRRSPEAHSNLCSRLFFTWASPLFALANRKVRVGRCSRPDVFRVSVLLDAHTLPPPLRRTRCPRPRNSQCRCLIHGPWKRASFQPLHASG